MKIKIILSSIGIYLLLIGIAIVRFGINKPNEQEYINQLKIEELENAPIVGEVQNYYISDWMDGYVTYYCSCVQCCGKTDGITASGAHVEEGITCAADKKFPFGTRIEIEGYGIYTVQDRGGGVKGNHIDIYCNDHQFSDTFGIKKTRIRVVNGY